jgi:hypothetical protein
MSRRLRTTREEVATVRRLTSPLWRGFFLVAALALGLTGLVAGTTTTASAQSTGPTDIDHFTCYTATNPVGTPTFKEPTAVELRNQFAPQGFIAALGKLVWHCNPVNKFPPGEPETPIVNANTHLVCFKVLPTPATTAAQPSYTVQVTNQFGAGQVITGQPVSLCLPSWKTLTPPNPPATQVQPPGLDHYLCYAVTNGANMPIPPPNVKLKDQFNTTFRTTVTEFGPANRLCVPTLKSPINSAVGPLPSTLFHPEAHLLCYPILAATNAPAAERVYDQNQFGIGLASVGALNELCVPSFKTPTGNTGTVIITKVGIDPASGIGVPLMGAVFTAYTDATHTTTLGTCTTDSSGTCQINGLPAPGTVDISETTAPPGFTGSADQTATLSGSPALAAVTFTDTAIG